MGYMTLLEMFKIPTYNDPDELSLGEVEFDHKRCMKCGICAKACPADSIYYEDKKPFMRTYPDNQCIFCGCCAAICPAGAITMKKPYTVKYYYKTIEHGEPKPPRL